MKVGEEPSGSSSDLGFLGCDFREVPALCLGFLDGNLIIETCPHVFVQELEVHGTLLVATTAEETPLEPLAPLLATAYISQALDIVVVATSEIAQRLADILYTVNTATTTGEVNSGAGGAIEIALCDVIDDETTIDHIVGIGLPVLASGRVFGRQ